MQTSIKKKKNVKGPGGEKLIQDLAALVYMYTFYSSLGLLFSFVALQYLVKRMLLVKRVIGLFQRRLQFILLFFPEAYQLNFFLYILFYSSLE